MGSQAMAFPPFSIPNSPQNQPEQHQSVQLKSGRPEPKLNKGEIEILPPKAEAITGTDVQATEIDPLVSAPELLNALATMLEPQVFSVAETVMSRAKLNSEFSASAFASSLVNISTVLESLASRVQISIEHEQCIECEAELEDKGYLAAMTQAVKKVLGTRASVNHEIVHNPELGDPYLIIKIKRVRIKPEEVLDREQQIRSGLWDSFEYQLVNTIFEFEYER